MICNFVEIEHRTLETGLDFSAVVTAGNNRAHLDLTVGASLQAAEV